jgi:hypothetical protein
MLFRRNAVFKGSEQGDLISLIGLKKLGGGRYTAREQADLISLLLIFKIRKIG